MAGKLCERGNLPNKFDRGDAIMTYKRFDVQEIVCTHGYDS